MEHGDTLCQHTTVVQGCQRVPEHRCTFNPLNTELNPSANNINNQLDATITVY